MYSFFIQIRPLQHYSELLRVYRSWMLQNNLSVFLLHNLGLSLYLLSFFFSYASFSIPFQHAVSYKTHLYISLICSHGQQHGVLSKMSILKGFPNFSRDPWARKLTNQPWESQALLSSLGSEPCVPLGTHTPLLSHHTHHLPGTWRESLPWRAACQELSYPKAPWGAGESSCVKPIVDFLEIWPLHIFC